ncbi:ras association domain-containing protein 10-like [Solea senegalensis]|uniref:Ras association domain-containing protein 10-like n=2 Tax=Solea senegalensis TaxID=28829 RepID=A0AAV6Q2S4_SOLSE|nr:ras association domain-containing protein 10-like [Solea senegalensis]
MESQDSDISVWVCREEKLVLGVSKRTSCADVVKVLVEDQNSQRGLCAAHSYCIVEKWRGFERILPHKTKILRLWVAWGEEQKNVKFVLVKSEASLENRGARSAEARVVRSKQSPCVTNKESTRSPTAGISPEKQRRIVRKAFRKLEKMNKKRARVAHRHAPCAEKMETLVHLVVSQDHTIRQQVQRISELDAEIERRETQVHSDRIKRHGINYVQDTYLVGAAAASNREEDARCPTETLAKLEEYAQWSEEVVRLQEELWEQEALTDIITVQIQEELNQRWMQRRREELRRARGEGAAGAARAAAENELLLEEERINTQLHASLYIGLRLNTDLESMRSDLDLTRELYAVREKEMRDLLQQVDTLDMDEGSVCSEGTSRQETDEETELLSALERDSEWVEQARGMSKVHSGNDDDSDTGLSSLHSQDSDSLTVWESLV